MSNNTNKKDKTAQAILNRPLKRSTVYVELSDKVEVVTCIGFCNPPRKFRAVSRYNKICPSCKLSDRWRDY